jgi:hypothetical protein
MNAFVTMQEASTINRFFAATHAIRELTALSEQRYLSASEGRKLRAAMADAERLRPQVAAINRRTFSNHISSVAA